MEAEYVLEQVAGRRYNSKCYKYGPYLYKSISTKRSFNGLVIRYYKCSETNCEARIKEDESKIEIYGEEHCHEPNYYGLLKLEMLNKIKLELRQSTDTVKTVFDRVTIEPRY